MQPPPLLDVQYMFLRVSTNGDAFDTGTISGVSNPLSLNDKMPTFLAFWSWRSMFGERLAVASLA